MVIIDISCIVVNIWYAVERRIVRRIIIGELHLIVIGRNFAVIDRLYNGSFTGLDVVNLFLCTHASNFLFAGLTFGFFGSCGTLALQMLPTQLHDPTEEIAQTYHSKE